MGVLRAGTGDGQGPRRRLIAVAALCMSLAVAVPAFAHDHRAPSSVMQVGELRLRGTLSERHWIKADPEDDRFCISAMDIFRNRFPRTKLVVPADTSAALIRMRKQAQPITVEVQAWTRVGVRRAPKGDPMPVPFVLTPHQAADGAVTAWDVQVTLPTARHVYLEVAATWADEEGCVPAPDIGSQHAAWRFHVQRAEPGNFLTLSP
jgi:hypothetical protein